MSIDALLRAMRADTIPVGTRGLWKVARQRVARAVDIGDGEPITPGVYTRLERATLATLHHRAGEVVMADHGCELRRHLEFVVRARGRVLVTGLGLGCVLRGLLVRGRCTHIDVVERDPSVLWLVAPHLPPGPYSIHVADARQFVERRGRWDFAWHDLWSDPDTNEQPLAVTHTQVLYALCGRVSWQGAWNYPRKFRRLIREHRPECRV